MREQRRGWREEQVIKEQVYSEGRTLERIAWHLTTSIPEYLAELGLKIDEVENAENVPTSAKEIAETFNKVSSEASKVLEQQWSDAALKEVQIAFGREETNAQILMG